MAPSLAQISEFDFESEIPDIDTQIQMWLPEIEKAARSFVANDRYQAFFLAALRMAASSKSLKGFSVPNLAKKAGYSRSTFFRLFEGFSGFLIQGYQLTCLLSVKVYEDQLRNRPMTLEEFCKFTADIFYSANCTVPNEICTMLWKEHGKSHTEFHPHLSLIGPIVTEYLQKNPATAALTLDREQLEGAIKMLDMDILQARLDAQETFPSCKQYQRLHKMFLGALLAMQRA